MIATASPMPTTSTPHPGAGGVLVATDGRALPLTGTRLTADAKGGVARVTLEQHFTNHHADPLHVTYRFPLPHDGAVSGFAFTVGERRITGEVDRKAAARERFERAILDGRTAGLLEQARGSVFEQSLGNVPAGADVTAEIRIDQPLSWLAEGAWEWRFPTALAPRYLGGQGRVPDAGRVSVEVAGGPIAPRLALALAIRDDLAEGARPGSPSHALRFDPVGGALRVALEDEAGAALDRDVVIRWTAAAREVGVSLDACRPVNAGPARPGRLQGLRAFGLLTLVPPAAGAALRPTRPTRRDLVALLDVSGSMSGEPLEQARRVVGALVDSLGDEDTLELVAFANEPRRWKKAPARATAALRAEAHRWLAKLRAEGSTEMRDGIVEALKPVMGRGDGEGDAQRQVVLVTDGAIGFEDEIIQEVYARLPRGSRLHTVGVGSAVNRSLTSPVARAGRGIEVVIGLGEDPERAARALVARSAAPLVTDVVIEGSALTGEAPRAPDLYAGAPALVPVALSPVGGTLVVRGRTAAGTFERTVSVPALAEGEGSGAVAALFARDQVEEHELRLAAGVEARAQAETIIEALGVEFQVSTRLTSWIAVGAERAVDPSAPFVEESMPQVLPHGMSAAGVGLRYASAAVGAVMACPPTTVGFFEAATDADEELHVARQSAVARAPRSAPPPGPKSMAPPRPPRTELKKASKAPDGFTATYRWVDGRLVITIVRMGPAFAWSPPASAEVQLESSGDTVLLSANTAASTRATTLQPGYSARLALEWPGADRPGLSTVTLVVDGATLRIPLLPASS